MPEARKKRMKAVMAWAVIFDDGDLYGDLNDGLHLTRHMARHAQQTAVSECCEPARIARVRITEVRSK